MFSSRSCALRSEFISSSSRACGAAEGAAHVQRAQPSFTPTPVGTSARPPPHLGDARLELVRLLAVGLDDLGAGAEHGRDLETQGAQRQRPAPSSPRTSHRGPRAGQSAASPPGGPRRVPPEAGGPARRPRITYLAGAAKDSCRCRLEQA